MDLKFHAFSLIIKKPIILKAINARIKCLYKEIKIFKKYEKNIVFDYHH